MTGAGEVLKLARPNLKIAATEPAGAALLSRFHWVIYVFGAILLLTGVKLLASSSENVHPERNLALRLTKKLFRVDPAVLSSMQYRHLSVFSRGGRSTAVVGVPSSPQTFYAGYTGGGVWRTTNSGESWENLSDGFFEAGSVGAIDVALSDPNVIYVGTGSACPRGNVSPGVGMYKSTDAGKTWSHVGLRGSGTIGRVRIHPTNPNVAYVAVLGNMFAPSDERGVYRTRDGGTAPSGALPIPRDCTAVLFTPGNVWFATRSGAARVVAGRS